MEHRVYQFLWGKALRHQFVHKTSTETTFVIGYVRGKRTDSRANLYSLQYAEDYISLIEYLQERFI